MSSNPAITGMVLRAKVVAAKILGRTLVQAKVLDEDSRDNVELLHPFGYVANPTEGSDTIELQIGGYASHKVQLGGDNVANALADLQPGEAGLSTLGQQIIIRVGGEELVTALLKWGPSRDALKRLIHEDFMAIYNEHTHNDPQGGVSNPPNQPMTAAHLTGGS
jgi:hypothetical protein